MSTASLIRRAAEGETTALGELVVRYRPFVYGICLGHVKRATEAEDLTQETFVRVYRDLPRLRDPAKFPWWLRKVARNVCRMWARRTKAGLVPLEAISKQDDPAASFRLRRFEVAQLVSGILGEVSARSREVLILHYLAGCTEAEIAVALGLPRATIKSRLREGRQQAKRKLLPVVRELLTLQTGSDELVQQIMARCGQPGCVCPDTLTEGR